MNWQKIDCHGTLWSEWYSRLSCCITIKTVFYNHPKIFEACKLHSLCYSSVCDVCNERYEVWEIIKQTFCNLNGHAVITGLSWIICVRSLTFVKSKKQQLRFIRLHLQMSILHFPFYKKKTEFQVSSSKLVSSSKQP